MKLIFASVLFLSSFVLILIPSFFQGIIEAVGFSTVDKALFLERASLMGYLYLVPAVYLSVSSIRSNAKPF